MDDENIMFDSINACIKYIKNNKELMDKYHIDDNQLNYIKRMVENMDDGEKKAMIDLLMIKYKEASDLYRNVGVDEKQLDFAMLFMKTIFYTMYGLDMMKLNEEAKDILKKHK